MYTVFWQEAGADRWDRLESEEDVSGLMERLAQNSDVCVGDVWVFTPEADNFAKDGTDYLM